MHVVPLKLKKCQYWPKFILIYLFALICIGRLLHIPRVRVFVCALALVCVSVAVVTTVADIVSYIPAYTFYFQKTKKKNQQKTTPSVLSVGLALSQASIASFLLPLRLHFVQFLFFSSSQCLARKHYAEIVRWDACTSNTINVFRICVCVCVCVSRIISLHCTLLLLLFPLVVVLLLPLLLILLLLLIFSCFAYFSCSAAFHFI